MKKIAEIPKQWIKYFTFRLLERQKQFYEFHKIKYLRYF